MHGPHSLVRFVTTRVVHLPKRTETSLLPNRIKADLISSYCSYARPAQPGPIRNHDGSTFTEKDRNKLISYYRIESKRTLSPAIAAMHGPHSLVRCTARTAWSDSDQAVRAVHSCNSPSVRNFMNIAMLY